MRYNEYTPILILIHPTKTHSCDVMSTVGLFPRGRRVLSLRKARYDVMRGRTTTRVHVMQDRATIFRMLSGSLVAIQ
jgi:hypothetical protein